MYSTRVFYWHSAQNTWYTFTSTPSGKYSKFSQDKGRLCLMKIFQVLEEKDMPVESLKIHRMITSLCSSQEARKCMSITEVFIPNRALTRVTTTTSQQTADGME